MITKVKQSIRKNLPDLRALLGRNYPEFVYRNRIDQSINEIPVIVFHEIEPDGFEKKLAYLKRNGYETLTGEELLACMGDARLNDGRKVALTFDDGHISLYRAAWPLLEKYRFRAISFICPGLVEHVDPEDTDRLLCSWREIEEMHNSGLVDFQLHSLSHDLVFTSPGVVDFFRPGLTSPWFGRQDIPYLCGESPGYSLSNIHPLASGPVDRMYGRPLFAHVPRYSAAARFEPSAAAVEECAAHVRENGGARYFEREDWRSKLNDLYGRASGGAAGRMVEGEEYEAELKRDFERSRALIEEKLPGNKVEHLCYPWYEGTSASDRVARAAGYRAVYYGLDRTRDRWDGESFPAPVGRLSDELFYALPGEGRRSLFSLFVGKFTGR